MDTRINKENHGAFGDMDLETLFGSLKMWSKDPSICPHGIVTKDVIKSLIRHKKNKNLKEGAIETYEKRWNHFARRFPLLPEKIEPILEYLAQFGGESGRHRRNMQDLLNMLYGHGVNFFNLPVNPMEKLERPIVTHKVIKVLTQNQIRSLFQAPEELMEQVAIDLMLGHGWRSVEVRRVVAVDVAEISEDTILVHGKEREELTPVLPRTQEWLKQMVVDLKPQDHLFVSKIARQGKRQPLGEDGMSQLVARLLRRTGIKDLTGHDLRRTFATTVTVASKDELLAMRLLRDKVPGVGSRYIKYPMSQLVDALKKYSPVNLAGDVVTPGASRGYK